MCAYVQANTNGRLHDAAEASISPLNRGFLYGDAIYEVWRTYQGVLFAWDEHWTRLRRSADALYLEIPFTSDGILEEIRKTVAAFHQHTKSGAEVYVRLQVSRGEGPIGLDTAFAEHASYVLLVQENKLYPPAKFEAGLALSVARDLRRNSPESLNPAWKTGNYLNNILCLREARARGADEVVIRNQRGEITEAAVSNLAFVRKGEVVTPPLSAGILAGITRQILLERVAPAAGIGVREEVVRPEDLSAMDECFTLSTTKDITPVGRIDDIAFKVGPGTLTARLKNTFREHAGNYVQTHPKLRVIG